MESTGPSGENKEYLFNLEKALLGLGRESGDAHISDLVKRCKKLEAEGNVVNEGGSRRGDGDELKRVGSTEEQEEIEKVD